MTDPTRQAFLDAIRNAPADDLPRLVFADYLEESGDSERAEYIRVQCEIAVLERKKIDLFNDDADWSECTGIAASWCPNCGDCCCRDREQSMSDSDCPLHAPESRHSCLDEIAYEIETLNQRSRTLEEQPKFGDHGEANWVEWSSPCPELAIYRGPLLNAPFKFRRGFVDQIALSSGYWLQYADRILAEHPVREVTLRNSPNEWLEIYSRREDAITFGDGVGRFVYPDSDTYLTELETRWPGIKFVIPERTVEIVPPPPFNDYGESFNSVYDAVRLIALRQLQVPARIFRGDTD